MPCRRFPPPWSTEVAPNCFIVRDANGQALNYIYYESEPGRRSAAKLLTRAEALADRSCESEKTNSFSEDSVLYLIGAWADMYYFVCRTHPLR